jgi:hypothetical protein
VKSDRDHRLNGDGRKQIDWHLTSAIRLRKLFLIIAKAQHFDAPSGSPSGVSKEEYDALASSAAR